ncbi:unnamed protein product [Clavelina lepadiformis]|uniref:CWH43-like N-terminal domain-containing protein n=1 Tax=Clavelina lepadiformis TaxID=159417 RepID=A0ABP0FLJ0_CLALP
MNEVWKSCIYWPLAFGFVSFVGVFACYGIAVNLNHVDPPPSWPFVSETGLRQPESSLFTFIVMTGSFTALVSIYLYYKYVEHYCHESKINTASLIVGCLACFSLILAGAFQ